MDRYLEECADIMLRNIKYTVDRIGALEKQAEAEMAVIRERYEPELGLLKEQLVELDKEIVSLMKENKGQLFDGREKISLANGILLFTKDWKVSLPRDAVAKIEEYGFVEAIKIAKSVDRAIMEKWPDERLFLIGGKRKLIEKFEYETKGI
ncbi:MAG: host-nuclease inhibitor Gam family protein [Pseudomonadota bacterium]